MEGWKTASERMFEAPLTLNSHLSEDMKERVCQEVDVMMHTFLKTSLSPNTCAEHIRRILKNYEVEGSLVEVQNETHVQVYFPYDFKKAYEKYTVKARTLGDNSESGKLSPNWLGYDET